MRALGVQHAPVWGTVVGRARNWVSGGTVGGDVASARLTVAARHHSLRFDRASWASTQGALVVDVWFI